SEEHTSELQSQSNLVCRLLLEKKKGTSRTSGLGSSAGLLFLGNGYRRRRPGSSAVRSSHAAALWLLPRDTAPRSAQLSVFPGPCTYSPRHSPAIPARSAVGESSVRQREQRGIEPWRGRYRMRVSSADLELKRRG